VLPVDFREKVFAAALPCRMGNGLAKRLVGFEAFGDIRSAGFEESAEDGEAIDGLVK